MVFKMLFSAQEKAHCVVWYASEKCLSSVLRMFRAQFYSHSDGKKSVPDKKSIKRWYSQFIATGTVLRKKRNNTRLV
jgi:hypothetical protein